MKITRESYFDHDADIGVIGRGDTLEKSFEDTARAMFAIMADLSAVNPTQSITIEFQETDVELALVTWLNLLLAKAYEYNFIFSQFNLQRENGSWKGLATGERWRIHIEPGVEVKGATLTMLSVKKNNGQWESRCIVDI